MSGDPDDHFSVTIAEGEAGTRLDALLARRLPGLSRTRVQALIKSGHVSLAGRPVTEPSYRARASQTFAIIIPESEPAAPRPEAIPLVILYEDEHLIVIDKPAGMVVHPAPGSSRGTLVNALLAHCGASLSGIGGVRRPGIVHRLDKDTSGVMVAAKSDVAHRHLQDQFAARTVERAYTAVVWGVPARRAGEVKGNIGRSARDRKKMAVVSGRGRPAITRYATRRALDDRASVLECRLGTGRTHQIRVHLAAIGHPVIGDRLYGRASAARLGRLSAKARALVGSLDRHALHAHLLGFEHPATGRRMRFNAKLTPTIEGLIAALERP